MDGNSEGIAPIVVVCGPSGAGKGTVIEFALNLACRDEIKVWLSVSDTTRLPRAGEIDGLHYNFISAEEFTEREAHGHYLESASFAGNSYGTPRQAILEHIQSDIAVLVECELEGTRQMRSALVKGMIPSVFSIFISPPSWEELERRLRSRGTEDEAKIQKRLERATIEFRASNEHDAILINETVHKTATELLAYLAH